MSGAVTVKMSRRIGGYRNGEPWPAKGDTLEVTPTEAIDLVAAGYAEIVTNPAEETTNEALNNDGDNDPEPDGDDAEPETEGDPADPESDGDDAEPEPADGAEAEPSTPVKNTPRRPRVRKDSGEK